MGFPCEGHAVKVSLLLPDKNGDSVLFFNFIPPVRTADLDGKHY